MSRVLNPRYRPPFLARVSPLPHLPGCSVAVHVVTVLREAGYPRVIVERWVTSGHARNARRPFLARA